MDCPWIAWWFSHQFFVCLPEGSQVTRINQVTFIPGCIPNTGHDPSQIPHPAALEDAVSSIRPGDHTCFDKPNEWLEVHHVEKQHEKSQTSSGTLLLIHLFLQIYEVLRSNSAPTWRWASLTKPHQGLLDVWGLQCTTTGWGPPSYKWVYKPL